MAEWKKYCDIQDAEPFVTASAAANGGAVDLSAAFADLKEQNPKMKVGFGHFEVLARQVMSEKGFTILSKKEVKPPPLMPRRVERSVPRPPESSTRSRSQEFTAKRPTAGPDFDPSMPSRRFSDVGGLESQKAMLRELVLLPLQRASLFASVGARPVRGILLHGPSGCGKTLLAEAAAGEFAEFGLTFFRESATDLLSASKAYSGQSEGRIRALFKAAVSASPSLVFIDEIDTIAQRSDKSMSRLISQFGQSMDYVFGDNDAHVVVIGATSHLELIDASLRRPGRFAREVSIGIPDYEQRRAVLEVAAGRLNIADDVSLDDVAREAEGFVGADIVALSQEAALNAVKRAIETDANEACASMEDFRVAVRNVQPTLRREGFATLLPASFADIGGLEGVKSELQMTVIDSIIRPEVFAMYGHRPSSGVLLYGPPGCGKTLLARALAHEANRAAFISIKGPELLNKYLGESESAVRAVFRRARDSAPCVIFFDELDAICPRRSDDSSNAAASRVVNQLLTEMDGVVDRGRVFVIGATNRPGLIDEAMLRPGRLDKKIEVPRPDLVGRIDILTKQVSRIGNRGDIDCEAVARECDGYSGADLEVVVSEAIEAAIGESVDSNWVPVSQKHFAMAVEKVAASQATERAVSSSRNAVFTE